MDKCNKCNKQLEKIDIFPESLCVDCYEIKMDKIPLSELALPDFKKTLR